MAMQPDDDDRNVRRYHSRDLLVEIPREQIDSDSDISDTEEVQPLPLSLPVVKEHTFLALKWKERSACSLWEPKLCGTYPMALDDTTLTRTEYWAFVQRMNDSALVESVYSKFALVMGLSYVQFPIIATLAVIYSIFFQGWMPLLLILLAALFALVECIVARRYQRLALIEAFEAALEEESKQLMKTHRIAVELLAATEKVPSTHVRVVLPTKLEWEPKESDSPLPLPRPQSVPRKNRVTTRTSM